MATDLSVPTFPVHAQLTYLAEGAANIIYRISFPTTQSNGHPASIDSAFASAISLPDPSAPSSLDPPDFTVTQDETTIYTNRLLRLRKTLPSAQPNLTAYAYLTATAFPLFPHELLVNTTLIRIPPAVIDRENQRLRELEATAARPQKRRGMYLEAAEPYAFLIADMSPHRSVQSPVLSPPIPGAAVGTGAAEATRQVLVEFKPKWVVQSPSAPATWKRCRTCALRRMKAAGGHGAAGFCPLDLASYSELRVRRAVKQLVPRHAPKGFLHLPGKTWDDEKALLEDKVVQFLLDSPLMKVLAELQTRLDPHGPLETKIGQDFLTAMTVRDLTVFLRVDMDMAAGGVDVGIGDLDMKVAKEGKEQYWRDLERQLIEEGWYEGTEKGTEKETTWCR